MRGGSLLKLLSKGVGLRAALLANNFRSVVFKLRHIFQGILGRAA